jgi:hypothetical protein
VQRTLYHFTASHLLPAILEKGLTKGVIPWTMDAQGRVGFVPGWQWLTVDPDWMQSWARPKASSAITVRRDEVRITVAIPPQALDARRLLKWEDLDRLYRPKSNEFIRSHPEWRYWRVFYGPISPKWFLAVERNPTKRDAIIAGMEVDG